MWRYNIEVNQSSVRTPHSNIGIHRNRQDMVVSYMEMGYSNLEGGIFIKPIWSC